MDCQPENHRRYPQHSQTTHTGNRNEQMAWTQTQPYTSAAHQHQGNHNLMEGHLAWTEEMVDKNVPEICTRWEKYAPMGVLDQQWMSSMSTGQWRW
jgi:hypothetical protein